MKAGRRVGKRAGNKSASVCAQRCGGLGMPSHQRLWHLCSVNRTIPASKGTRQMFEKMSEIRAKRRQRWLDEGRRQERERVRAELRRLGVTLRQETIDYLDGKNDESEQ